MAHYYRKINISTQHLGKAATLVLVFDEQPILPGMYRNYFPVVWRVCSFSATESGTASTTYKNQLVSMKVEVENDMVTEIKSWKDINVEQQMDSTPQKEAGDNTNEAQSYETSGIGFHTTGAVPTPLLVLLGPTHSPTKKVPFTPILRVYITESSTDYDPDQILRRPIPSPVLLEQDLATLEHTSNWKLNYDPDTNTFSITKI